MKFKLIFALFNGVVILSFLFIFLMPVFFLGWDYTQLFWSSNWIIAAAFAAVMIGLNAYFAANWKLFSYLESENWHGLISYLEDRIYNKGRYSKQHVRVIVNTYVVVADTEKIRRLEEHLRGHRPDYIPRFALHFGIPHLVGHDPHDIERYYGEMRSKRRCKDRPWIDWSYAFALMLQEKHDHAKSVLLRLLDEAKNPILRLLTVYLLDAFSVSDNEVRNLVVEEKRRLQSSYTPERWEREVEKNRGNLQVVVLSKLIRDAGKWAFGDGSRAA